VLTRPTVATAPPDTVVVHIPMAFARRGGRKALITPDGSPARAPQRPHTNSPLVTALAHAFRWRKQLETGAYATIAEIAAAEGINDSYTSRILRLTLLAPHIVEAILDGHQSTDVTLGRLLRPFPVEWASQRRLLSKSV